MPYELNSFLKLLKSLFVRELLILNPLFLGIYRGVLLWKEYSLKDLSPRILWHPLSKSPEKERTLSPFLFLSLFLCLILGANLPLNASQDNPWTPETALTALKEGNLRFVSKHPNPPHLNTPDQVRLATEGQVPLAAILSCSDSRVPVELIFDQGIGDIFSIRVAGAVPGVEQVGSLEYAVEHLGVPLVIVLSHTQCGAVTAAVTGAHEEEGALSELLQKLSPIAQAVKNLPDEQKVERAVILSAQIFKENLFLLSPILLQANQDKSVLFLSATYHLDTGEVIFD
ncbi:MAG: carbonic anhydrase [Deltaproteobacteria bacterium]|jgi:carbonic anhydrase|nr:carbonic anhydrase [Deltaproteobacteria bacterium]